MRARERTRYMAILTRVEKNAVYQGTFGWHAGTASPRPLSAFGRILWDARGAPSSSAVTSPWSPRWAAACFYDLVIFLPFWSRGFLWARGYVTYEKFQLPCDRLC